MLHGHYGGLNKDVNFIASIMPGILIVTTLFVHGVCPLKVLFLSSPHFSLRNSNTNTSRELLVHSEGKATYLIYPGTEAFLFHSNRLPVRQAMNKEGQTLMPLSPGDYLV